MTYPRGANVNIYAICKELGIATIKAHFQGGNDEGGYDQIEIRNDVNDLVPGFEDFDPYNEQGREDWDPVKRVWVKREVDDPRRQVIAEHLESILNGKYGSFAGDFNVYGTVIVDVAAGTTTMKGVEEVAHGEDFEEAF